MAQHESGFLIFFFSFLIPTFSNIQNKGTLNTRGIIDWVFNLINDQIYT